MLAFNSNQANPQPRKRGSACTRCRLQKVRCGNQQPACSNCVKAGVDCIKFKGIDAESSKQYIQKLEKRTQWLETVVRRVCPDALSQAGVPGGENEPRPESRARIDDVERGGQKYITVDKTYADAYSPSLSQRQLTLSSPHVGVAQSPAIHSPAASSSSQIGPKNQPLAHDVGLLSLANSTEPKYLGPSSGVPFARLIFAAAPQSQGLPSSFQIPELDKVAQSSLVPAAVEFADLPKEDEMRNFVDAYFEIWHPLYPLINEEMFQEMISRVQLQPYQKPPAQSALPTDLAQLFLILALGAKALESRLSTDFSSDSYYATAMFHIGHIQLHDSIPGVQILLLLVLASFSFTNSLNAWFLTSTIIASCLDLGLQRKFLEHRTSITLMDETADASRIHQIRSGIFWSAYSLDRTLSVILGRPLTLRDEAIDIEFPGERESGEIDHNAVRTRRDSTEPRKKRVCLPQSPYAAANYSFRFDRITAEVKLMIYRVAQSPSRFPWPSNLAEWQEQTAAACRELIDEVRQELKWRGLPGRRGLGLSDRTIRLVELKFHQSMMLLYRPSPAFPQPSPSALIACYDSAVETIRIQSELARFANMTNSWLTAHAVFVSGITMLYCLWTSPQVRKNTDFKTFSQQATYCTSLLSTLGETWSVAKNAQIKLEQLVALTEDSWKSRSGNMTPTRDANAAGKHVDLTQMGSIANYGVVDDIPPTFWDGLDVDYAVPSTMLMDELGDMGTWFDLDWLGDANFNLTTESNTL